MSSAAHSGQGGVFAFRSYGQEDGLGDLAVFAIAQDAEGFLWVGTEDGLYRYDGHQYRLWGTGLRSNIIWEIATGRQGGLWVNTDEGIYCLEGADLIPLEGLSRQRAGFMALGPGASAVAAQGNEVFMRRGPGPMKPMKAFPGQITTGWASPDLNGLLVTTETQIWRFQGGTWDPLDLPRAFHGTACRVFKDHAGRIYLRNRSNLWRRDNWDASWVDLTSKLPGNAFNAYPPVEDALGRIWVGTSKGLVCFQGDDAWVLGESKGLPGGWAGPVFVDREGSLWVGSEGLQRLKGRFVWSTFDTHQGLPSPNVWDIGRSMDGRIFACTDSGVAVLKGETWSVVPGTEGRTLLAGGGNGKDSLWFGGSAKDEANNVLFRLNLTTARMEKVSIKPVKTTDLVLAITAGPGDGVYVGTRFEGVLRVYREKSAWKTEPLPFPDQRSSERINSLIKDRSGNLFAASERGLFILENGRWTGLGPGDGLLGSNCASLARDPKGSIWVSYLDARGISRLGQVNGAWKVLESSTQPKALFKDFISSMAFDPNGVLWLGTAGGMKRWNGQQLDVFGRGDGLGSQDPSANGITAGGDGSVWQGFSNGIAHFDPSAFKGTPEPPSARILDVQDASRNRAIPESNARIPYKDHTLTFQFSALSFVNESHIVHEVRLVGLENEWRETQLNEARYPALPDGAYRFEVRSRFREGEPGPVAGYSFRILPPWWGTWWFRTLTALGAMGLLLTFLRRRTSHLSRRNTVLEKMVAHRTEALVASKVELEKANKALEEATLVDPLTGLHNRRFLDISLPMDTLQAQRTFRELVDAGLNPLGPKEDILLFLMDIDQFKIVNDTYGHQAGDQVLVDLSMILRNTTRASDSLVRWGGEEFLLVARRTRRSGAPGIANNLLEAIRAHTFRLPDGVELQKTWSIGFTAIPVHPQNPEFGDWQQALKIADQCLYAAKNTGRDRWVGAFMLPGADITPIQDLKTWDVGTAVKKGLIQLSCSDPEFRWPD